MSNFLDVVEASGRSGTMPVPRSAGHDGPSVPCVYCHGSIPASTFAFWTNARRLMSATCPDCERRVTLATPTWRRWVKQALA
jgi:hypothetical protein